MKRIVIAVWCALACACFNFDEDLAECYRIGRCVDAGTGGGFNVGGGFATGGGFVTGGGSATGGGDSTGGGGPTGGGGALACDPTAPNNTARDTDCDGLSDAYEYAITWVGGLKTDPCDADTDDDGLLDGVEAGSTSSPSASCSLAFVADVDPTSFTNPTFGDTDGDGRVDGAEDLNRDGARTSNETDPLNPDSDCDGLIDGAEYVSENNCTTNALDADTDHDGLTDSVERGLAPRLDTSYCAYSTAPFDLDSSTRTNPCVADTDGDGISDGVEDGNGNGRVDLNEFDPSTADPNITGKCTVPNAALEWRDAQADLSAFFEYQPETNTVVSVGGVTVGTALDFGPVGVSYAALMRQPGSTPTLEAEELRWRAELGATLEVVSLEPTRWRDEPALLGRYRVTGAGSTPNDGINTALLRAFGSTVQGQLSSSDGGNPSLRFDALFVLRGRVFTSIAVTEDVWYRDDTRRSYAVATSVGRATDTIRKTCQVFNAGARPAIDMLWVVDDSSDAGAVQTALHRHLNSAETTAVLSSANVDWRFGFATPGVQTDGGNFTASGWVSDVPSLVTAMKTSDGGVRTNGSGVERGLLAAQTFKSTFPARPDAGLHVVFTSAADDVSGILPAVFSGTMAANVASFTAHGFVCPEGTNCGAGFIQSTGRYQSVVRGTSGVLAPLNVLPELTDLRPAAYLLEGIARRTGYQLSQPLALPFARAFPDSPQGVCFTAWPSSQDGFNYDERERRLSLSGTCRANTGRVVVRSVVLEQKAPTCDLTCPVPFSCNATAAACECESNCGGKCPTATTCNAAACRCEVR